MWPVTEWAVCGQREGIVWFYLTFNSTRQVSISHQIVQTRANVLVCMGIHQNLYSLILSSFSLFQILNLLSSEMRQQQKFRGWFDYTWSRCRCSERREISISINYRSDRFHVRFREVMKYAVRDNQWWIDFRLPICEQREADRRAWLLSGERSHQLLILTSPESGVMAWEETAETIVRKTPLRSSTWPTTRATSPPTWPTRWPSARRSRGSSRSTPASTPSTTLSSWCLTPCSPSKSENTWSASKVGLR